MGCLLNNKWYSLFRNLIFWYSVNYSCRFNFVMTYIIFNDIEFILGDDLLLGALIVHIQDHNLGVVHQFIEVENLVQGLILEEDTKITIYAKLLCNSVTHFYKIHNFLKNIFWLVKTYRLLSIIVKCLY